MIQGRTKNQGLSTTEGALLAQLRRASEEVIAWCELPYGGAQTEHADGPAATVKESVAKRPASYTRPPISLSPRGP